MIREPVDWPDLVFHVLAHVAGTAALPASAYDPAYVGWAARHLGSAHDRPLGEDAIALAALLPSHELLATAQLVAWLFESVEQAMACADRDLLALGPGDVDDAAALRALVLPSPAHAGAEFLRCAALLEAEAHASLPPATVERDPLAAILDDQLVVAPDLQRFALMPLRALRLRGRVHCSPAAERAEIWTGLPSAEPGPTLQHVAWQAAHEATVAEVGRLWRAECAAEPLGERGVEAVSVVLLGARARAAGRAAAHCAWLAHFAAPPSTDPAGLPPMAAALFGRLAGRR